MPLINQSKLEDQRSGLIRFIEANAPQGNNAVTIVFDGQEDVSSPPVRSHVKVIYSKGESADDKIKKIVKTSSQVKSIVVVTDDRDIQYSVRASGAKVMSVGVFLKQKNTKISVKKQKIDRHTADEITAELEDLWLKGKSQSDDSED